MPTSVVKKIARVTGKSTKGVESDWEGAKAAAHASGRSEKDKGRYWGLVTHIMKNKMSKKALKKAGWKRDKKKHESLSPHEDPLLSHISHIQQVHDLANHGPEAHSLAQRILHQLDQLDYSNPQDHFSGHHGLPLHQQVLHHTMGTQPIDYGEDQEYAEWLAQQFKEHNPTILAKLKHAMQYRDYKFLLGKLAQGAFWGAALIASPYLIGAGLLLRHQMRKQQAEKDFIQGHLSH